MKRLGISLLAVVLAAPLFAQPGAQLIETLPAVKEGRKLEIGNLMNPEFSTKRPEQLRWTKNKEVSAVIFVKGGDSLIRWEAKSGAEEVLTCMQCINKDQRIIEHGGVLRFPQILEVAPGKGFFKSRNSCFLFNSREERTENVVSLDKKATNFDISPVSEYIAYTKYNNLLFLKDGMKFTITYDLDTGIVNGQAVHRNEFGINKGTFWSSDGHKLAYYHMDESMVQQYPLADYTTDSLYIDLIRYPEAGKTMHNVTVGVFNTETFENFWLEPYADPSQTYITSVTWGPEDRYLYLGLLDRNQKDFTLVRYDTKTGKPLNVVFEEHNDVYVEPESGIIFRPRHNDQFIWLSERNGFNHIYLYNTSGNLLKALTPDNEAWMVTGITGFSLDGKTLYFTATKESPLQENLYALDVDKGKMYRVTQEDGVHRIVMDNIGNYFIDYYSAPNIGLKTQVIDNKGKVIRVLENTGDLLQDFVRPEFRLYKLKADDGVTDLYGRMILPPDFDPEKKYPVLVYVYGGPHAQMVTKGYNYGCGTFLRFLAQEGYIVWSLDNRGSANRGFAFESAIHRRIGEVEARDQMTGIDFLKSLPYVDADRIGIDGWSYGGFMTLNLKTKYPDVFKVATAGGPVINWEWYEVMYGERYMGTPQDNPEGYANANLLNRVDSIRGKVMILQGGIDPTVTPKNATTFVKKCIDKKIPVDFFIYPAHEHNVRGYLRDHLYEKLFNYYRQNL